MNLSVQLSLTVVFCRPQRVLIKRCLWNPSMDQEVVDTVLINTQSIISCCKCNPSATIKASALRISLVTKLWRAALRVLLDKSLVPICVHGYSRLLHRMIGSSLMIHPEQWQEALPQAYEGRTVSWIVLTMVVSFLGFLYGFWFWQTIRTRPIPLRSRRKSLLSDKGISKWSSTAPTTFIGPSLKMKSN
jgi:hypothetical protein